uniref:Signal recognition particle 14 kDa protein n=1 Tax=Thelazia callipaeda TaxID=103827 RepID=A0A0N5D4H6_THECL
LPEDVSDLDKLKHYAPLFIIFVNNDLECRRLPVEECQVKGQRRLFVSCGNVNVPLFKKLDYLVRHYANTFQYSDSKGRKSRFPDDTKEEESSSDAIMNDSKKHAKRHYSPDK